MEFGLVSYGFGLLAGLLSTLSPCVLPILPILIGSAADTHPKAPLALAVGLAISYAIIGMFIAWIGTIIGFDTTILRDVGAVILGLLGLVLMSTTLQQRFASATSGIGNMGNSTIASLNLSGLRGQFIIGLALGVVWSPCVGPTLGSAIVLASQGKHLIQVFLMMSVFGVGAAMPVMILAYLSRAAVIRVRGRLLQAGKTGKMIFGFIMIIVAAMILSGGDKSLETWFVRISPDWLTKLTTQF